MKCETLEGTAKIYPGVYLRPGNPCGPSIAGFLRLCSLRNGPMGLMLSAIYEERLHVSTKQTTELNKWPILEPGKDGRMDY